MYMLTTLVENNRLALHSAIRIKDQELIHKGKLLRGRLVLWLIRNRCKTHPSMSVAHSITDLTNRPWLGDRVAEFIYRWDFLVTSVKLCGKDFSTQEGQGMLLDMTRPKLANIPSAEAGPRPFVSRGERRRPTDVRRPTRAYRAPSRQSGPAGQPGEARNRLPGCAESFEE